MKIINCWDIQVWDGADGMDQVSCGNGELADEWKKENRYDSVYEKQFIILDSYEELMDYKNGEARKRVLSKSTEEDKIALGLK
jgi:hypothetical protein